MEDVDRGQGQRSRGEQNGEGNGPRTRNETRLVLLACIYPSIYLCLHLHPLLPSSVALFFLSNEAEKLRDVRFWILSREEETICAEENYLDSDEIWTDDTVACWGPCNAQGNPSVMALFLDVRTRLSERVAFKVIRRLYFRCTRDTVGRRIILRLRIIWTRFTFVWRKRRMGFRRFG